MPIKTVLTDQNLNKELIGVQLLECSTCGYTEQIQESGEIQSDLDIQFDTEFNNIETQCPVCSNKNWIKSNTVIKLKLKVPTQFPEIQNVIQNMEKFTNKLRVLNNNEFYIKTITKDNLYIFIKD